MTIVDLDKFLVNLFFGKIIKKVREWKIKRYKSKKVKVEAKNSPEKIYDMQFKVAIRDKNGLATCDSVFHIQIPANGYFYAKKKLESYVIGNIDVEVINFKAISSDLEETEELANSLTEEKTEISKD